MIDERLLALFGIIGFRKMIARCTPPSCEAKRITSFGLLVGTAGNAFQRAGISSAKFHSLLL